MVGEAKAARYKRTATRKAGNIPHRGLQVRKAVLTISVSAYGARNCRCLVLVGAGQTELAGLSRRPASHKVPKEHFWWKRSPYQQCSGCMQGRIGYVPDDRKMKESSSLSVQENICIPSYPKASNQLGRYEKQQKQTAQLYYNKLHVKSSGLGQKLFSERRKRNQQRNDLLLAS